MVEVYIQIFDEIWTLSPTRVTAIFSSLPCFKEVLSENDGIYCCEFFFINSC